MEGSLINAAADRSDVAVGEIRETSTMKFPVPRFTGERGRWRYKVTSYCWSEARVEESDAMPYGCPLL